MSVLHVGFYSVGVLFLLHSLYGALQFNQFRKATGEQVPLPLDIVLEVAAGVVALVVGAVLLLEIPPQVAQHDGKTLVRPHRFLKPIAIEQATVEFLKLGESPFDEIEFRPAFLDVAAKRKEFLEWKRGG